MESTMPADKDDKYFIKWLEEKFSGIAKQIENNTRITKEQKKEFKTEVKSLHDRISNLENSPQKESKLPPFYRDPKVIQIALLMTIALVMLVAAVTGFDPKAFL